jgi:Ca2+-binding EF-hand superfamily protein
LTKENLIFAFHHFDTDNEGTITKDDLKEVFRRQGASISDEVLDTIIIQAKNNIDEKLVLSENNRAED